jgi:hypothetical protein
VFTKLDGTNIQGKGHDQFSRGGAGGKNKAARNSTRRRVDPDPFDIPIASMLSELLISVIMSVPKRCEVVPENDMVSHIAAEAYPVTLE